jgi:tetratricopeptide (TPR) repeat protein
MSNSRLDKLLEMLKLQPDDPFLLYAVGFEYESSGDDQKATGYYETILQNNPDYLPVYYQVGLFYSRTGNPEKGIRLLNQGIDLARQQNDRKTLRELMQALEEMEEE